MYKRVLNDVNLRPRIGMGEGILTLFKIFGPDLMFVK